jgi:hypothetical protein
MDIHQIQVQYDGLADRLLLRIRTRDAQAVAVWLTRRMVSRLLPAMDQTVSRWVASRQAPQALAVPEAREMMVEGERQKALAQSDFRTPFDGAVQLPLGEQPLLPEAIDLGLTPQGGVLWRVREAAPGRSLELQLRDELVHGLMALLQQALAKAEWGLGLAAPDGVQPSQTGAKPGTLLN